MTITLSSTPVLETARLTLRAPQAGDWPAFNAMLASDRAEFIRSGSYDLSNTWRAFGHMIGHWVLRGFGMFVLQEKAGGAALGMCGPWYPATWPEAEIGWTIWNPAAEGRGFAREAALAVRRHVYADLGWRTAVSYIDPANARSRALAESIGARIDPAAASFGDTPVLVYRHPSPEDLQ